jgi:hypothetical protein
VIGTDLYISSKEKEAGPPLLSLTKNKQEDTLFKFVPTNIKVFNLNFNISSFCRKKMKP